MKYFLEIAYNGKNYNGWQSQNNGIGVQAVVENSLSKLLQDDIRIVGSGRTDAGVHCKQQFFHMETEKPVTSELFLQKLNSFLPSGIVINSIREVKQDANARYDAIQRTYEYKITRRKNPFLEGYAWHFFKPVNLETMNAAAALLLGEQDFECFSKVKTDVNHFICEISFAKWSTDGNQMIFTISANRFLRGMVRAIVGTLLDVGTGKITMENFMHIIQSKDRKKAGANVPPYGLYLMKVEYPSSIFIS